MVVLAAFRVALLVTAAEAPRVAGVQLNPDRGAKAVEALRAKLGPLGICRL